MSDERPVDRNRNLAIALSGGGSRSAAFAIGAMDCLVDRNLLDRVKVISSSSGGCLVNAAVAKAMLSAQDCNGSPDDAVRYELERLYARLVDNGFSPYTSAIRAGADLTSTLYYLSSVAVEIPNLTFMVPLAELFINLVHAIGGRAVTSRMQHELAEWFADRRSVEGPERVKEPSSLGDIPLSDLARSPIDHYFVASDLTSAQPVYLGAAGLSDVRGNSHPLPMTMSEAATISMTFPGYLLPLFASHSINGVETELVDGGLYDNLALSCYLALPLEVDHIVAVDAGVVRPARTGRGLARLRLFARSLASLHVRSTELYAEFLKTPQVKFERLRLPGELQHKTTLGSLKPTKAARLRLAGRNALEQVLAAGFLVSSESCDSVEG